MPPDRQQTPRTEVTGRPAVVRAHSTSDLRDDASTSGSPTWYVEAEAALRDAGRKLEALGVTDPDAARLAGAVFRFASRVRTDRTGVTA